MLIERQILIMAMVLNVYHSAGTITQYIDVIDCSAKTCHIPGTNQYSDIISWSVREVGHIPANYCPTLITHASVDLLKAIYYTNEQGRIAATNKFTGHSLVRPANAKVGSQRVLDKMATGWVQISHVETTRLAALESSRGSPLLCLLDSSNYS